MDFSPHNVNESVNTKNVAVVVILFLILMVVSIVIFFVFFGRVGLPTQPSSKVYLSLAPISDQGSYLSVYTLDTNTSKFNLLLSEQSGIDYLTPSFSQDGSQVALISFIDNEEANILIIPRGDFLLGKINQDTRSIGVTYYPEYPEWSPSGKYIAYSIFEGGYGEESDILSPDDYYVYTLDLDSEEEVFVTKGVYPQYIDENKILVLKSGGLYIIDLNNLSLEESLVWSMEEGEALANMKFNIASDKSKIIWTIPWMQRMFEIRVSSWSPFSGEMSELLSVQGYIPFYSADGNYLSYIQLTEEENVMKADLTIYDILSRKEVQSVNLSEYYTEGIFLSDWR